MSPPDAPPGPDWRAAYEEGRRAWPHVSLAAARFVARAAAAGATPPADAALGADLYLAYACAEGDEGAMATLEQRFLPGARPAIARVDSRGEFVDEVVQELRTKLLCGPLPRIARYAGRGPLLAWIRVAASRAAIDLLRAAEAGPTREPFEPDALTEADLGPEAQLLKGLYRQAFQEALAVAFAALSAEDRNILRRHLVHDMTLDEIAAPYGVHAATIARRLAALRESIANGVRQALAGRFRELAAPGAMDSLARAIRSQVYVSLGPLIGSGSGPGPKPESDPESA
jgi:RNA polymerase sigma-70 factor (ECF subfamily)